MECILQPLRLYPVDAAILLYDILVITECTNIEVAMTGGVQIQVPNIIANTNYMRKLILEGIMDKIDHDDDA